MLIWWGNKIRDKMVEEGLFTCSECAMQTPYILRQYRNYFTLFSIPLIPLEIVGFYAECTRCQTIFKASAIDGNTTRDEVQESVWDKTRRVISNAWMILIIGILVIALGRYVYETFINPAISKNNPAQLFLINDTDSVQTMYVASAVGNMASATIEPRKMAKSEIYEAGKVTVSVNDKTASIYLHDPKMITWAFFDGDNRLIISTIGADDEQMQKFMDQKPQ
jgi:hypothetical protein